MCLETMSGFYLNADGKHLDKIKVLENIAVQAEGLA